MREETATGDAAIAELAARQHGVVTADQLVDRGISKDSIHRRVRAGRLHRVHRAVFAVGHQALSNEGRWMAAVLALGEGAALSHRSAAEHLGLLPPSQNNADVIVTGRGGRDRRPGIRIHRSSSLTQADVIRRKGIPVTTPVRTLRDLRRIVPASQYRKAVRQASVLGYGLGGVEVDRTRSELEYLFLKLCKRHRLPEPEVNVRVGPFLVDFLWRGQKLAVETDGRRYHQSTLALEEDEARDQQLRRWGYTVRRFSWAQVTREPRSVVASVRAELG